MYVSLISNSFSQIFSIAVDRETMRQVATGSQTKGAMKGYIFYNEIFTLFIDLTSLLAALERSLTQKETFPSL